MSSTSAPLQFASVLGDLYHKRDVYIAFGYVGSHPQFFFSNTQRAFWLREYHPELVPTGSPNSKTLATIFECNYYANPEFVSEYCNWLYSHKHAFLPTLEQLEVDPSGLSLS